jgi:peptidoglycan/xylan/chitin deacetylase (PgdA/CDA1 family)
MRRWVPILALFGLVASSCATAPVPAEEDKSAQRSPAAEALSIPELFERVFHLALAGQLSQREFDEKLHDSRYAGGILESEAYGKLLAVKAMLDEAESRITELHFENLRNVLDLRASKESREKSEAALKEIADQLDGNQLRVSRGVKSSALFRLRYKQDALESKLDELGKDLRYSRSGVQGTLSKFRAKRASWLSELLNSKVDPKQLEEAVAAESGKEEFQRLQHDLREMGQEMLQVREELQRDPATQQIAPGAGPSGNITGNGFPEKVWSLTYDDGPGASTTPSVLKNLEVAGIKATFFMLAEQVDALPAVSQSIKSAGHDLASHSYTHKQLTKVGPVVLDHEITGAKKRLEEKLATQIKLFRLPYGAGVSVQRIRQKIAGNNLIHVFWNVDTLDWNDKNPDSIVKRAQAQMKALKKDAGILLFHDVHPQSVKASAMLVEKMKAEGKRFCTVQAVVDRINGEGGECQ